MKIENTRRRFTKRIKFERKVLSIINNEILNIEPLHGLSNQAISHWTNNAMLPNVDDIALKLEEISKSLQIFCDYSKNAFEMDKRINSNDMEKLITELKHIL